MGIITPRATFTRRWILLKELRQIEDNLGLPVGIADDGRLRFKNGMAEVKPEPRRIADMLQVLHGHAEDGPDPLYLMYRDVVLREHDELFQQRRIRHDVTVITPGVIGREFVKTAGHYHTVAPCGSTYPEVYQVVSGRAMYILQLPDPTHDEVILKAITATPGDVVVVPPDYGHVTVNIGDAPLVMVNLVERDHPSRYEPYRALGGAAAYVIADCGPSLLLNSRYRAWKRVAAAPADDWADLGLSGRGPIYWQFVNSPDSFNLLVRPEEASARWWA